MDTTVQVDRRDLGLAAAVIAALREAFAEDELGVDYATVRTIRALEAVGPPG